MKLVKKSVLLWYSAREMYTLVIGVEQYPGFLPWCERGEVLTQDACTWPMPGCATPSARATRMWSTNW
jgi:ribosome-associated toxin RatA of RatAB toxin-antitoxin module